MHPIRTFIAAPTRAAYEIYCARTQPTAPALLHHAEDLRGRDPATTRVVDVDGTMPIDWFTRLMRAGFRIETWYADPPSMQPGELDAIVDSLRRYAPRPPRPRER
jgi:hypothetical protein